MTFKISIAPNGVGKAKEISVLKCPSIPHPEKGNPKRTIGLKKRKIEIPNNERNTTISMFERFFHAVGMACN